MSEQSTWLSAYSAFTVKELQKSDREVIIVELCFIEQLSIDDSNNGENKWS